MRLLRRAALAVTAAAVLAACQDGTAPAAGPVPAPSPSVETVPARLGDVPLVLEVADTPEERAVGLMGREQVPPGTGMVFRYDEPVVARFYMFRVPVPLTAVFILGDRVVHTVVMPPCPHKDPQACPRYGPDAAFDTVVETAPETVASVRVGDAFSLRAS